jgi:hypothetical protein
MAPPLDLREGEENPDLREKREIGGDVGTACSKREALGVGWCAAAAPGACVARGGVGLAPASGPPYQVSPRWGRRD